MVGEGGRGVRDLLTEFDKPWYKILAMPPPWRDRCQKVRSPHSLSWSWARNHGLTSTALSQSLSRVTIHLQFPGRIWGSSLPPTLVYTLFPKCRYMVDELFFCGLFPSSSFLRDWFCTFDCPWQRTILSHHHPQQMFDAKDMVTVSDLTHGHYLTVSSTFTAFMWSITTDSQFYAAAVFHGKISMREVDAGRPEWGLCLFRRVDPQQCRYDVPPWFTTLLCFLGLLTQQGTLIIGANVSSEGKIVYKVQNRFELRILQVVACNVWEYISIPIYKIVLLA
jgi:hypothetical protein